MQFEKLKYHFGRPCSEKGYNQSHFTSEQASRRTSLLQLISCLAIIFAMNLASATDIVLGLNETAELKISRNGKIEIIGSDFLQVKDLGGALHIRAKKIGHSIVRALQNEYNIFIFGQKEALSAKKLKNLHNEMLKDYPSIGCHTLVYSIEDMVPTIKGELKNIECYKRFIALGLSDIWNFKPHMSSEIQLSLKPYLINHLMEQRLPVGDFKLYPYPQVRYANLKETQLRAVKTWQKLTGIELQHFQHLNERHRTLEISLYFVEAKKQWLQSLGVSWPPSQSFQVVPQLTSSQLQAVLNFTGSEGLAHNLASPKLLIKSGEKGEFLSGGEFPIRVSGFQSQALHWKKYGLMFSAKPKIDDSDRIDLELEFELSMIDPSRTVDGLPGLISHRMQTQIQVQEGQTIMTTSLLKKEWGRSSSGIPGLKEIPLLGRLFESEDFINNHSELLLFIQTKVIDVGMPK